jgi:hypothetical protein
MIPADALLPLPYSVARVHAGFSEATGLARMSHAGLTLEYQVRLLGFFRFAIREITVPFEEIAAITLKKNLLYTRIILQTRSLRTLSAMPGSKTGQLVLRVARRDRETAALLVSALRLHLSELAVNRLTNHQAEELPAGPASSEIIHQPDKASLPKTGH